MLKRAFTIVELIVVMAIVFILLGILFVVLGPARSKAMDADTLSNLHQISLAGQLYFQENEHWPESAEQLVKAEKLPKELIRSKRDRTSNGIAWSVAEENAEGFPGRKAPIPGLFDSFPGYAHWPIYPLAKTALKDHAENGGWLVDLTISTRIDFRPWLKSDGPYRRVTFDGSVITRQHRPASASSDPQYGNAHTPFLLYSDPNEETKKFWQP